MKVFYDELKRIQTKLKANGRGDVALFSAAGPIAVVSSTFAMDMEPLYKTILGEECKRTLKVQRGSGNLKKEAETLTMALYKILAEDGKVKREVITTGWPHYPKLWEITLKAGDTVAIQVAIDVGGTNLIVKVANKAKYGAGVEGFMVAEAIERMAGERKLFFEIKIRTSDVSLQALGRYSKKKE